MRPIIAVWPSQEKCANTVRAVVDHRIAVRRSPFCNARRLAGLRAYFVMFQYQRVRKYRDKPDVRQPLIRNREVGLTEAAIRARLARISCFNTNRLRNGVKFEGLVSLGRIVSR